jgi:beta-mannosidase
VFDGLDTFAYIELCDQPVGNADNQFRQWYFDVSSIVQSCNASEPTLSVNFGSASKIVAAISEHGDRVSPLPSSPPPLEDIWES